MQVLGGSCCGSPSISTPHKNNTREIKFQPIVVPAGSYTWEVKLEIFCVKSVVIKMSIMHAAPTGYADGRELHGECERVRAWVRCIPEDSMTKSAEVIKSVSQVL